jgi:acid phosphatase family membrane protein YuiD
LWVIVPTLAATAATIPNDVALYGEIHNHWPNPEIGSTHLSHYVTYLGEGYVDVAIVSLIGIIGGPKEKRVWLEGLEALAAAAITTQALKYVFGEERPGNDPTQKHYFAVYGFNKAGMPSGHSMAAFATATVLAREYHWIAPVAYLLATAVAISRIQEGAHWPSDVIVGAGFGILQGWEAVDLHLPQHTPVTLVPLGVSNGGGLAIAGPL